MQPMPKTAAIVPVYNVEDYLEECVDSLLAQTVPFDRIVLVDDGSTDSSWRIAERYACANDHIDVVHKRNAGLGAARNSGLDALEEDTDYVVFVDSDDLIEPDLLEHLLRMRRADGSDCVFTQYKFLRPDGTYRVPPRLENALVRGDDILNDLIPRLCGDAPGRSDRVLGSVCGSLYRADLIREHSIRFESEREIIYEDVLFNIDYFSRCDAVTLDDSLGYVYRGRETSLTHAYVPDKYDLHLNLYHAIESRCASLGVAAEALERQRYSWIGFMRKTVSQEEPAVSRKSGREVYRAVRALVRREEAAELIRSVPASDLDPKSAAFAFLFTHRCALALTLRLLAKPSRNVA